MLKYKITTPQVGMAITMKYDLFGNVYKETYPSGYCITSQYDKYGYLTGITDGNNYNIYWTEKRRET